MNRYRFILPYILNQWPYLVVILLLTIFTSILLALQPWPLMILIDFALTGEPLPDIINSFLMSIRIESTPLNIVLLASIAGFGILIFNSMLNAGLAWAWTASGNKMVYDLAVDLFDQLQRLSLSFHQKNHLGDLLNRLSGDAYCAYSIAEALLISPLRNIMVLIMIGYVSWSLNKELTLISFAIAPLLGFSAWYFGGRLKQLSKLDKEAHSRLMSFVHQTITAIPLVQAFTAEKTNKEKFDDLANHAAIIKQKNALLNDSLLSTGAVLTSFGVAIILIIGGHFILAGILTVGGLLVFLDYLKSLQDSFNNLLTTYGTLKSAEASIDRVLEVLYSEEKVPERSLPVPFPEVCEEGAPFLSFTNVSFAFEANKAVLKQINLKVNRGETIAITGETGSGKSTLLKLIPRFIDPTGGSIAIGGVDIRNLGLADIRARIAIVQQESFLFPVSVAENIAMGKPDATMAEIREAAVDAGAHEFIRNLPDGYHTIMSERGTTLSGGQRQRISIARALLKNAPILLLDEPTSALDSQTEAAVMDAIERLMKGRTTFLIAHRLSTICNADKILVLEKGEIVEDGTQSELINRKGKFFRLLAMQKAENNSEKLQEKYTESI